MRRIVTGEGPDGRSMSVSEGPPPRSVALRRRGDMTIEVLWEVAMPPQSPAAGGDADEHFPFEPPPGVARFGLLTVPPDSRGDRSPTITSWRSTKTPAPFDRWLRPSSTSQPNTRTKIRYSRRTGTNRDHAAT